MIGRIVGLAVLGLAIGIAVAALRSVDPVSALERRMAAAAAPAGSGDWQSWLDRLTAIDPADAGFPALAAQALDVAPSATALAQVYAAVLAAPVAAPRIERWRTLATDHLRVTGGPLLAADLAIRQADQALLIEHSATAALALRERADLDFVAGGAGWPPARCENRRRLAALHLLTGDPAAGLELLGDSAFSDAPALAPIYRGTLAAGAGLPAERIRAAAGLDAVPALAADPGALAAPGAPFRLFAAALAAEAAGSPEPAWERRAAHLATGASAAAVAAGTLDAQSPDRAALARIATLRRSGIHAGDAVKGRVWTWAVR